MSEMEAKANVSKSAVMVFSVDGAWKWREHVVSKYTYLGVDFTNIYWCMGCAYKECVRQR